MTGAKILRVYLDETPLLRMKRGNFNFLNRLRRAFEAQEFRVEFRLNSEAERLKSVTRRGYSLFHMDEPFHPRALTMRKAYYYPFWRIENTAQRWNYGVAQSAFDPTSIDPEEARTFGRVWRKTIFGRPSVATATDGYVYVPLQGRLLEHRSFQSTSPIGMINALLRHEPDRQIILGLHPRETYLPEDLDALKQLIDGYPRLRLSSAPMDTLLANCDYVATENSSVALAGFFLSKPAVLFAKIDFHHIASNVFDLGEEAAIKAAPTLSPEYEKYLLWFLKHTSIVGGAEDAEAQILKAVRHHGWDV
jgi:hypothetical protein